MQPCCQGWRRGPCALSAKEEGLAVLVGTTPCKQEGNRQAPSPCTPWKLSLKEERLSWWAVQCPAPPSSFSSPQRFLAQSTTEWGGHYNAVLIALRTPKSLFTALYKVRHIWSTHTAGAMKRRHQQKEQLQLGWPLRTAGGLGAVLLGIHGSGSLLICAAALTFIRSKWFFHANKKLKSV